MTTILYIVVGPRGERAWRTSSSLSLAPASTSPRCACFLKMPLITERIHTRKVEFDFPIKELVEAKKKEAQGVEFTSLPLTLKVSIAPLSGEKDTVRRP